MPFRKVATTAIVPPVCLMAFVLFTSDAQCSPVKADSVWEARGQIRCYEGMKMFCTSPFAFVELVTARLEGISPAHADRHIALTETRINPITLITDMGNIVTAIQKVLCVYPFAGPPHQVSPTAKSRFGDGGALLGPEYEALTSGPPPQQLQLQLQLQLHSLRLLSVCLLHSGWLLRGRPQRHCRRLRPCPASSLRVASYVAKSTSTALTYSENRSRA